MDNIKNDLLKSVHRCRRLARAAACPWSVDCGAAWEVRGPAKRRSAGIIFIAAAAPTARPLPPRRPAPVHYLAVLFIDVRGCQMVVEAGSGIPGGGRTSKPLCGGRLADKPRRTVAEKPWAVAGTRIGGRAVEAEAPGARRSPRSEMNRAQAATVGEQAVSRTRGRGS